MSLNPLNWDGFEADYQQMVRAFKHIQKLSPKSRQAFVLSRIAKYFDVPRSAFARLFKTWDSEQGGEV
jgi:monoamine oxidase